MRSVFWEDHQLKMIDQRILPARFEIVAYRAHREVARAIQEMVVRGAPAIGAAAAFGGIRASLKKQNPNLLMVNKWLKHIKDIYRLHEGELDALGSEDARVHRLVELNVIEQIYNLAHTSIIQGAWNQDRRPILHGWVYGLQDGIIKELISLPPGSQLSPIYEYADVA